MSTCFAEPSTLCAYCAADPGGDFLAKGTHLRVLPSRMLGLPLMPFVAMPVNVLDIREKLFVWGDDPVPEMGADLDAAGGERSARGRHRDHLIRGGAVVGPVVTG